MSVSGSGAGLAPTSAMYSCLNLFCFSGSSSWGIYGAT